MCGSKLWNERGLIPRIIIEIFQQIKAIKNTYYDIYVSYLEIYNENAYDLLDKNHSDLEKTHSQEEQEILFRTHQHLKQMEKSITEKLGTVILK